MVVLIVFVLFVTAPLWLLAAAYIYAIYCMIKRD